MSVIPDPDPRKKRERQILTGETPNPVHVPPGCRFHPRCPIAQDVCSTQDPELQQAVKARAPDHRSACLFT